MPVLAIDTFRANMVQLLNENLDGPARSNADAAIRERLSELISRLKNPSNYAGQAGMNVYEDVSRIAQACSQKSAVVAGSTSNDAMTCTSSCLACNLIRVTCHCTSCNNYVIAAADHASHHPMLQGWSGIRQALQADDGKRRHTA